MANSMSVEVVRPVSKVIEVIRQAAEIVEVNVAKQGVAGPPGQDAVPSDVVDQIFITLPAAGPMSGHRVVSVDDNSTPVYCDAANIGNVNRALGVTVAAVTNVGENIKLQRSGKLTEPSWSFVPGAVYAGIDGTLTQNLTGCAFLQQVGVAISATTMVVGLQPAIALSED